MDKPKKTCSICRNYFRDNSVILTVCKRCEVKLISYRSKKRQALIDDLDKELKEYHQLGTLEEIDKVFNRIKEFISKFRQLEYKTEGN